MQSRDQRRYQLEYFGFENLPCIHRVRADRIENRIGGIVRLPSQHRQRKIGLTRQRIIEKTSDRRFVEEFV